MMKKLLTLLLVFVLVLALASPAFAETSYTVRIFAGNMGTIGGGSVYTTTVTHGDYLSFAIEDVTVTDSKYFVRGLRLSGTDNSDMIYTGPVKITEHTDFVVSYGIMSTAVQYTVEYLSTSGKVLAPTRTLYGSVGDKPVVAHVYVEDYVPQAYNLTKTLVADESQNVFTFVYSPVPTTIIVIPVVTPRPSAAP